MAVSAGTPIKGDTLGNLRLTVTDVTFDSSYVTGGEPLVAASLGLQVVKAGWASIKTLTAAIGGINDVAVVPQTDGSVLLKANAASAQVPNATDLSTVVVTVFALGY
jgi:hypothetical protein